MKPAVRYTDVNVYDASLSRLDEIFSSFDNIVVAFSGGKDSGVLLNLVLDHARDRKLPHKIGVFHLDYEAQYSATTDFVDTVYEDLPENAVSLRCCVPVKTPTCVSMHETFWRPWGEADQRVWVRPLPTHCLTAKDFDFDVSDLTDYEFQERFASWYHRKTGARRTCVLIGIRAQESLDRWRTIVGTHNRQRFKGRAWTTELAPDVFNAYPIYDWQTDDIWTANARFGWRYNRLYDLFYLAGVPLNAMRVASPFHNSGKSSLHLYRVIDPHVWGRLVSRVNGVNFTALYGGTKVMGWKNVEKPDHLTWEQYAKFLLDTLPPETAENYRTKLATSIKFWAEKGGALPESAIADLKRAGIKFDFGSPSPYRTQKTPVRMSYVDDVHSADFSLIPTWKRLCICILKNDHTGKYMGFSATKRETERRKAALEKYRDL